MTARARVLALRSLAPILVALVVAVPVAGKQTNTNAPTTATSTTTATATTTASTTRTLTSTTTTTATASSRAKPAPAKHKKATPKRKRPIPPMTGSLGSGSAFPDRTLLLSVPSETALTPAQVQVTENGTAVPVATVKPLTQADAGEFGVMLVIDQSPSMTGRPLEQAMAAARSLAAHRSGMEELGVITFADTANVTLPLTSDTQQIDNALATTPSVGQGTRILPALMLALTQLSNANVAAGGVILLSDGGDWEPGTRLSPQAIGAAAQATGVPIFTIGLKDSHYSPAAMQTLAALGGGRFVTASGDQVSQVFTSIEAGLSHRFLVRYRSSASPGQHVAVTAHVTGVPGELSTSYTAPLPPRPQRHQALPPAPSGARDLVAAPGMQPLLPWPSFAPPAPNTSTSFWGSSRWILPIAVVCGLLIGMAILVVVRSFPRQRELQLRVESFTALAPETDADDHGFSLASGANRRSGGLLERRRWWPAFVQEVDVARFKLAPVDVVKRWAIVSIIAAAVLGLASGTWWLAIPVLLLWPRAMRMLVRRQARRQRTRFNDQLPSYLQDLAGAMRAGRSIVGAFAAVADSSDEPIRGEFERLVADEQLGRPLEESLEAISRRMHSEDMDQVALIAALHRRSGSNVAEALDRVAEGSRERADMRREMRALTGQARLSSWVLTALPALLLIAISLLAPKYEHPLFHTLGGLVLLGFASLMVVGGWTVMQRIIDVEV